jgi:hypothetical protein
MASGAGARAATVVVGAQDDLYNAGGGGFDGLAPQAVNVAGLSSITFSVSTGATVTVNGGTYNDADGGGSVQGELNTGGNSISGITAPTAGFIAGVFEGATLGATPAALSFVSGGTPGTVGFSSLSPSLQQAFFIGDGLTGDGTGATQTFYIPTGATTLYLGLTDACGYSGSPSCFGDNFGSFTVTTSGAAMSGGVPEPATWAMMLGGFGGLGAAMRSRRKSAAATI